MKLEMGMKCWASHCDADRQTDLHLCIITGFYEFEGRQIAELEYVEPFVDAGERMEFTSDSVKNLERIYEYKMQQMAEFWEAEFYNRRKS